MKRGPKPKPDTLAVEALEVGGHAVVSNRWTGYSVGYRLQRVYAVEKLTTGRYRVERIS